MPTPFCLHYHRSTGFPSEGTSNTSLDRTLPQWGPHSCHYSTNWRWDTTFSTSCFTLAQVDLSSYVPTDNWHQVRTLYENCHSYCASPSTQRIIYSIAKSKSCSWSYLIPLCLTPGCFHSSQAPSPRSSILQNSNLVRRWGIKIK